MRSSRCWKCSRTAGAPCVWAAQNPDSGQVVLYDEHYMGKEEPAIHAAAISGRGAWIPGVIDIQHIRLAHFCIMFAFFAFVIHHVYSAVLVSWEERNGLIESIFTGYKFVPKAELEEDAVQSKAD